MNKRSILLLLFATFSTKSFAIEEDHQKHFAISYALAVGSDMFCGEVVGVTEPYERMICSFSGSFAVGLAKEVWDGTKPDNKFDVKDLGFDIAGASLGSLTPKLLRDWNFGMYKSLKGDGVRFTASYQF
ncbi:hypothetical protein [Vibrio sp. D431a]|uniref:hypothetical protein n=1 Tax=Vibrio sp. D431a TaxID=2837388 RepID=UPI002555D98C|nr:hypothetical protein [Vibrio sp. D431a]MDK9790717.1 hypothetical protein [Vibrio sp. D431a]